MRYREGMTKTYDVDTDTAFPASFYSKDGGGSS